MLDRTKLGEQDLILTILAKEGDQVRVVAKGARKPGSRLAARSELFCDIDVLVSMGRGLGLLTEAQIVDAHAGVRVELDRLSCASAMAEVARLTCFEDMEDPYLHPILNRALLACEQVADRAHLDLVCAAYAVKVLSHCGWRPVLDGCVACGEMPVSRFSVAGGGVVCDSCARSIEGAEPITDMQVGWLGALVSATFDELVACDVDQGTASYLLLLAQRWASTHLDSRLRAMEFFAGL